MLQIIQETFILLDVALVGLVVGFLVRRYLMTGRWW